MGKNYDGKMDFQQATRWKKALPAVRPCGLCAIRSIQPIMSRKTGGGTKKKAGFKLRETPTASSATEASDSAPPPPVSPPVDIDQLGELPQSYGSDTIFLIAQEPHWLFTYWDIDISRHPGGKTFLRVYQNDNALEAEIEVPFETRNWYIPVKQAGSKYTVEIGYHRGSVWNVIARSYTIETPTDRLSESDQFNYATIPLHLSFQKLMEGIQEALRSGETLMNALSRLQMEGKFFGSPASPGLALEQRLLLEALFGTKFLDELASGGLSSQEVEVRVRKHLEERLSSMGPISSFTQEQLSSGESSLLSALGALSSAEVSSWGPAEFSSWAAGVLSSWAAAGESSAAWSSETVTSWAQAAISSWLQAAPSSWAAISSWLQAAPSSGAQAELSSWLQAAPSSWPQVAVSSWLQAAQSSWAQAEISSWFQAAPSSWAQAAVSSWLQAAPSSWGSAAISSWLQGIQSSWAQAAVSSWFQAAPTSWTQAAVSSWFQAAPTSWTQAAVSSWLQSAQSSWAQAAISSWGSAAVTSWGSAAVTSWSSASEWVSSFGVARSFFMHVNAEVIFYGGTDPRAKVTVDGKPITLNPDGTFRYHFIFPDGVYEIPIVAVSPDGVESRSAVLRFQRGTQKTGKVEDTSQPPLAPPMGSVS
jgi:hypothetical protein